MHQLTCVRNSSTIVYTGIDLALLFKPRSHLQQRWCQPKHHRPPWMCDPQPPTVVCNVPTSIPGVSRQIQAICNHPLKWHVCFKMFQTSMVIRGWSIEHSVPLPFTAPPIFSNKKETHYDNIQDNKNHIGRYFLFILLQCLISLPYANALIATLWLQGIFQLENSFWNVKDTFKRNLLF